MEVPKEITPAGAAAINGHFPGPVLAAVDLQPGSDKPVLWACEYARSFNAPVTIVHIVHDPASSPGFYSNSPFSENPLDPMETVAERMLESLLDDLKRKHPDLQPLQDASIHLVSGLPKTRIGEVSDKLNARLLVIGRRKKNGMKNFMKSSISKHLAKKVNITMVVV